jgi:hypothetical protein
MSDLVANLTSMILCQTKEIKSLLSGRGSSSGDGKIDLDL